VVGGGDVEWVVGGGFRGGGGGGGGGGGCVFGVGGFGVFCWRGCALGVCFVCFWVSLLWLLGW